MNETILSILSLLLGSGSLFSIYNIWKDMKKERKESKKEREEAEKNQNKKIDALMFGVQASLRDRLLQAYRQHEQLGYMPYEEKEAWLNSYSAYHSLGVNGVMDSIKEKVLAMPLSADGNKKGN